MYDGSAYTSACISSGRAERIVGDRGQQVKGGEQPQVYQQPPGVGVEDRSGILGDGQQRDAGVALPEVDPDASLLTVEHDEVVGTVIAGRAGWRAHLYRLAVRPHRRRWHRDRPASGKAKSMLSENKNAAKRAVDKAVDVVDEKRGGKYPGQVDMA